MLLYNVVTIGPSAFYNCNKLTSLTLGSSVVTIDANAFWGCTSMTGSLTFPSTLTTIGATAFYNCYGFTGTLTISANITSIGEGAFAYTVFNAIDVSANSGYHSHDSTLYQESTHTAIHGLKNASGSIAIEGDALIIGAYCFVANNSRTGDITIPNGILTINANAFNGMTGTTGTVTISNTVTLINDGAFSGNYSTTFDLGTSVVTIGNNAFLSSKITGTLTIPNSVVTLGAYFVSNCTLLTGIVLGTSVQTIGVYAFYACPNLTGNFNLPASVITLAALIFQGDYITSAPPFTSITSSSTNYPAYDNVLYDCKTSGQIKAYSGARGYAGTLTLLAGTTSILPACFRSNTLRTGTLTILSTVTDIGTNAFALCSGITECYSYPATAPTTSTSFGNYAIPLHIPTGGGTGYGDAPWTTTAIFSSITANL
jgi:hypothetical protein